MAHEIIERNHGAENLLIAGIPTRGEHLSVRLADLIERFESMRPQTAVLDPSAFRDDAHHRHMNGSNGADPLNGMGDTDVVGMRVVVVDAGIPYRTDCTSRTGRVDAVRASRIRPTGSAHKSRASRVTDQP